MSSRWWLYRGGTQIQWGRNEEPLAILTAFTESDKYADEAWLAALARSDAGYGPDEEEQQIADEDVINAADSTNLLGYRARVAAVRARLDLMGFTAAACRHELTSGLAEFFEDEDPADPLVDMSPDEILDRALVALESGVPDRLLDKVDEACMEVVFLFVESGLDRRALFALQLESADDDEEVRLDLYDLYMADYFKEVDDITKLAADELAASVSSGGPIIVVTEGVTDARYLARALELVAPHVAHMFRFLDEEAKAEHNSGQVMRTLRSFAAAGVTNRVVGVLDNDAAGQVAARALDAAPRPATNRYLLLPDVPYGESYPTNGPSGDTELNINGRAVSIEFQFGLDQLRVAQGDPAKVEWKGPQAPINVYQGSLSKRDKEAVQRNIDSFLESASPDHDPTVEPWPVIHTLVERLIQAAVPGSFPGQSYLPVSASR
ncbi:MAG TPA: hypothetical protein VIP82_22780 [Microbacterium sp.]|uniref:hypothetical protein n=1 Tax=Microbacterium sp. TaxID=51671 RepID=UPI002F951808